MFPVKRAALGLTQITLVGAVVAVGLVGLLAASGVAYSAAFLIGLVSLLLGIQLLFSGGPTFSGKDMSPYWTIRSPFESGYDGYDVEPAVGIDVPDTPAGLYFVSSGALVLAIGFLVL